MYAFENSAANCGVLFNQSEFLNRPGFVRDANLSYVVQESADADVRFRLNPASWRLLWQMLTDPPWCSGVSSGRSRTPASDPINSK